jgi:hypothetical protein
VGEQLEINLGEGEVVQGRWTIRTQFPRPGRWEVWCRLDTPGGVLNSPKMPVAVRLVASDELMAASTSASRNLLRQAEGLSWRTSSKLDDGRKPELMFDGSMGTHWMCARDDKDPWVYFEVKKGIRASKIRVTPPGSTPLDLGKPRPTKLRFIVNKRDVYEVEVPADPWEKAVLDLGKKVRIKQLEIHITAMHGGTLGQTTTGISELELEE